MKGQPMTIAVPLDNELMLYHDNPFTAPKFAIYFINGDKTNVSFKRTKIVENPRCLFECNLFDDSQIKCDCDVASKADIEHICEHYALLESIGSCSYLLADRYCENTSHTLKNGGISVFKIPTIINDIEMAIKNFLIGASYANKIQNIHNAS
jgi:predicted Fe-Mo cluster-binding NifX family protein